MIAVQFLVNTENSNENKVLLQMLETGVTYIDDRGYYCFSLLAVGSDCHRAGFIFRSKSSVCPKAKLP